MRHSHMPFPERTPQALQYCMLSFAPFRSRWITPVSTAGAARANFCKCQVMGKRKVQVDSDDEVALDVEEEEQEVRLNVAAVL